MLPYFVRFMLAVIGRIVGHYICKLLDSLHNRKVDK